MAKNAIPKGPLDEMIALTREYYSLSASRSVLSRIHDRSDQIEDATGIHWLDIENLVSAILPARGIKPDATNEDIYAILRRLGWEVSD